MIGKPSLHRLQGGFPLRFHIFAISIFAAGMAQAEDFAVRADVTGAVVYGGGTEVTRRVSVSVPAGAHRVLVPVPAYMQNGPRISVTLPDGRALGPIGIDTEPGFENGAFDTSAQAELRAGIDAIDESIEDIEAAMAGLDADMSVLAVQRRFLESYASGSGTEGVAPGDLGEVLGALGTQMQTLADAIRDQDAARASLEDEIAELQEARAELERALAALYPLGANSVALVIPVELSEAAELDLAIDYFIDGPFWELAYTAQLSTVENRLTIERSALVGIPLPDRWEDVALTLSGEEWGQVLEMTGVWPSLARIEEERPVEVFSDRVAGSVMMEPVVAPIVVMEDAGLSGYGLAYSAEVASPQTLTAGEDTFVPFAPLALDAEISIEGNPRHDQTAFLVARAENTTGEPMIMGEMSVYRDGAFLSDRYLDTIPPGGEVELPFGSVDHLQLFWHDLSRNEGDEGFFNRSNMQVQIVEFGVTNLSDRPETMRLIYAVPYSEQDDLDLDLELSMEPSEENLDGRRGIHAWDLTVEPGEIRTIRMEARMSWPEGYDLYWRP